MSDERQPDDTTPERGQERDERTRRSAAAARMQQQSRWVELQVERAVERGDFDELKGFGKPIEGLGGQHDPDWWLKKLVEREQVSGVLPPALQLRKDDAELDERLDGMSRESDVRRELEEFNDRVRAAFYQPLGGPPLITQQRDLETEVGRWRERGAARQSRERAEQAEQPRERRPRRLPWRRR